VASAYNGNWNGRAFDNRFRDAAEHPFHTSSPPAVADVDPIKFLGLREVGDFRDWISVQEFSLDVDALDAIQRVIENVYAPLFGVLDVLEYQSLFRVRERRNRFASTLVVDGGMYGVDHRD